LYFPLVLHVIDAPTLAIVEAIDFTDREVCTNGQQLHRTLALVILRATAAILSAIPAILWESCGIILVSFTILVGSVKNPSNKLLQFGSIHVPIPHFRHQLIGVVLLAGKKKQRLPNRNIGYVTAECHQTPQSVLGLAITTISAVQTIIWIKRKSTLICGPAVN
jgi:hypothetical protein